MKEKNGHYKPNDQTGDQTDNQPAAGDGPTEQDLIFACRERLLRALPDAIRTLGEAAKTDPIAAYLLLAGFGVLKNYLVVESRAVQAPAVRSESEECEEEDEQPKSSTDGKPN